MKAWSAMGFGSICGSGRRCLKGAKAPVAGAVFGAGACSRAGAGFGADGVVEGARFGGGKAMGAGVGANVTVVGARVEADRRILGEHSEEDTWYTSKDEDLLSDARS
ncbi:hypothetical protein L1987_13631 [Smallanthus sonchifolius]|uniref:Uncharacterized protein n=1 Tax=Smallanthus sonchifolius TaxID=185202 RepID=A0ACB9JJB0_9ASTR|nr:hypothetical protein L1987_13631 [Smallanthus sonchifolius]